MNFKPDSQEIELFIDELQNAKWLDKSRGWWPRFIYHFTNINNAVSILENEKLFSRNIGKQNGTMITDNASTEVIEQTVDQWKDYVRLYFRPRVPTQYNNEGLRPIGQRALNSHCPVPIYLMFDSKKLLSREGVWFSQGSLASSVSRIYSTAADLKQIPFHQVYHDTFFNPSEKPTIIYHRQAEVVIRDELDLTDLKHIWCRSEAEYATLLNLLSPTAKEKWKSKIGGGKKGNLFFRNWIFVEEVNMNNESINFKFNTPITRCDPVHILVEIFETSTNRKYIWELQEFAIPPELTLSLSKVQYPQAYEVSLVIDGQIMFYDKYNKKDLDFPF